MVALLLLSLDFSNAVSAVATGRLSASVSRRGESLPPPAPAAPAAPAAPPAASSSSTRNTSSSNEQDHDARDNVATTSACDKQPQPQPQPQHDDESQLAFGAALFFSLAPLCSERSSHDVAFAMQRRIDERE